MLDVPKSMIAKVVFDQSQYVKAAVGNVLREGGIGLVLAIPITAALKAICDHVPGLEIYAKLLGD